MHQSQGSEKINEEGAIETNVETVDQRSPPGRQSEEPRSEKTTVVHLIRKQRDAGERRGGVLGSAAAAVANTVRSAKDAIFGKGKARNDN